MALNECGFLLMSCINLSSSLKTADHLKPVDVQRYNVAITRSAEKYNVSPYLLLALFKVESNLGAFTGRSPTNDYGPMQINIGNIQRLHLTIPYVTSPEGAMNTAAHLLSMKRDETGGKGCWWSVYNSRTPKYRMVYEAKVKGEMKNLGFNVTCTKNENFLSNYGKAVDLAQKIRKRDIINRVRTEGLAFRSDI